jgi:hypothetical protein
MTRRWAVFGAALCVALSGCRSSDHTQQRVAARASGAAASREQALDRLEPGELTAGKLAVFGFLVPRQMTMERRFLDEAHLSGTVSAPALAVYVRKQVTATHIEMTGSRTIFEQARINAGDPQRVYRIEIVPSGTRTALVVRDVTPPPTVQGLSEEERWKRAGMTPDGKLADPKSLE